jgi:hypothetical protein
MASPTNKTGYVKPAILVDDADNVIPVVDDAAFTAGSNGVIPVAGVYQSTVDEVNAGDAGAVRMTARRAQVSASDSYMVTLFDTGGGTANPAPWSSSVNGDIRDTSAHDTGAPSFVFTQDFRWRRGYLHIYNGCNATLTVTGYDPSATLFSTTVTAGAYLIVANASAATGGSTVLSVPLFDTPILGFQLRAQYAGGAPTSGSLTIRLVVEV